VVSARLTGEWLADRNDDAADDGNETCVQFDDLHVDNRGELLVVKILGLWLPWR